MNVASLKVALHFVFSLIPSHSLNVWAGGLISTCPATTPSWLVLDHIVHLSLLPIHLLVLTILLHITRATATMETTATSLQLGEVSTGRLQVHINLIQSVLNVVHLLPLFVECHQCVDTHSISLFSHLTNTLGSIKTLVSYMINPLVKTVALILILYNNNQWRVTMVCVRHRATAEGLQLTAISLSSSKSGSLSSR